MAGPGFAGCAAVDVLRPPGRGALLDRLNRSGLDEALPILERMVASGDLQRLADLARLVGAGQEAMTDEMVGRMADTTAETLNLLEKVHQSELEKALPILDQMICSGDLERMASLARLVGSAQEAMIDEMVGRLSGTVGQALTLLDRMSSTGVLERLVDAAPALECLMSHMTPETIDTMAAEMPRMLELLESMSQMHLMEDMLKCVSGATEEAQKQPEAKGGFTGLLAIMKQKETQDLLQFVVLLAKTSKSAASIVMGATSLGSVPGCPAGRGAPRLVFFGPDRNLRYIGIPL